MKKTALLTALAIPSLICAQDTIKVSLSEALNYSISNNKTLQSEALHTQLNKYKLREQSAALYPNISADGSMIHSIDVPKQYVAANALTPTADPDQYVGLKLQLPNSFSAGLTVNWTIYNQGVFAALKIINAQNERSEIQFQKNRNDLAFTVSQLYFGIIFIKKQQESLLKVASNTDRLIRVLQSQYDNGLVKKSDLDKVQVSKGSIISQLETLKTSLETQTKLLELMMGVPSGTYIVLSESNFDESLKPLSETGSKAENTFDFQLMQTQVRLSKLERKTIWASYIPTVDLLYNYSYNAVSPHLDKVFSTSFTYPQQFIGINLSLPIFDGNKNLYRLRQNTITSRQLDLQTQFLSERIHTEIINAQLQYNSSLAHISSNEANIKLAEKLYGQSVLEYQQGTASLNDVLTTENTLQRALSEYFNSVSNALMALLEYKKVTHTILTK